MTTTQTKGRTLDQRISAADMLGSEDLQSLITEVEQSITAADEAASNAAARAGARTEQADAEWLSAHLLAALPPLRALHCQAEVDEAYARWIVDYEKVAAQHAVVVEELRTFYPQVVDQLTALLTRAAAVDAAATRLFLSHPDSRRQGNDGRSLRAVELAARAIDRTSIHCLSIMTDLKLPAWTPSGRLAWPVSTPPSIPAYNPPVSIHSAARDEEREKEAARMADFYANQERVRHARDKDADREAAARQAERNKQAGWAP
jgi:hypothetical protein